MRKGLIVLLVLAVLSLSLVFIFIPARLNISETASVKATSSSIFRYLSDQSKWARWWPAEGKEKDTSSQNAYQYNGLQYRISNILYNAVEVEIKSKDAVTKGKIIIIPVSQDSVLIQWQNTLTPGNNPLNRIADYTKATNIKKGMAVILDSMKAFNENTKRVYRFNIHHTSLKDTFLVATKMNTPDLPTTGMIYKKINQLKKYIAEEGAREQNYPMINVTKNDSGFYNTMVAIATNKMLPEKGDIVFRRMIIYKNKVLVAEVKGGPAIIKQAYDEIATYMNDYKLTAPVISFEYLITDRSKEADTSKWVTELYFPIA